MPAVAIATGSRFVNQMRCREVQADGPDLDSLDLLNEFPRRVAPSEAVGAPSRPAVSACRRAHNAAARRSAATADQPRSETASRLLGLMAGKPRHVRDFS